MIDPDAEQQARDAAANVAREAVGEAGMLTMSPDHLNWFEGLMTKMVTAAISTTASVSGKGHGKSKSGHEPQYWTDDNFTGKLDALHMDGSNWIDFSTKIKSHVQARRLTKS